MYLYSRETPLTPWLCVRLYLIYNSKLWLPIKESLKGLRQFGVIPFEIRTLKKDHTEQRRTRRFYITAIVRHRGTIGAWRNRGYLRVFINVFVYFITKQWFARFLKTFITKAISNTYTTALSLFVPSAPPWYCLLSPPCSPPLCVTFIYVVGLLYHSIFRKSLTFVVPAFINGKKSMI